MLQVATASIEDMRDLSRAPLTLLASLISVSRLFPFAYSVTDVCHVSGDTASSKPGFNHMIAFLARLPCCMFWGLNVGTCNMMLDSVCSQAEYAMCAAVYTLWALRWQ